MPSLRLPDPRYERRQKNRGFALLCKCGVAWKNLFRNVLLCLDLYKLGDFLIY